MANKRLLAWFSASLLALLFAVEAGWAEEPKLDDQDIADAIEGQYLVDRNLDVNRIDIQVQNGIVDLTGRVDNPVAKERAGRIAGQVKGVRSVSDRIRVVPSLVLSDAGIQQEVESALRDDPAADAY